MAGSKESQSTSAKKISENGNGLLLYQCYSSYYCQKVVLALNEKKIKYKSRHIDIYSGEQFEPWFIKVNPKCEVPVLKDGVKIIPDSRRIIDYLEDNFSNGSTPRLIPEKGTLQFQMSERLRDMLDTLPIQMATYGCITNPQLTGKINLTPKEITARQGEPAAHDQLLQELQLQHREYRDHYEVRRSGLRRLRAVIADPMEVDKAIMDIEYALKTVEKELATHTGDKLDWWVCSDKFTVADISLCVLLHRCHTIGLLEKVLPELPHLTLYWARALRRDSLRRTLAGKGASLLASLPGKRHVVGLAVVAMAAVIVGYMVVRSRK